MWLESIDIELDDPGLGLESKCVRTEKENEISVNGCLTKGMKALTRP